MRDMGIEEARRELGNIIDRARLLAEPTRITRQGKPAAVIVPICPTCGGAVMAQADGTLFPHQRYVDGGGYAPGQSHEMVPCKGEQS